MKRILFLVIVLTVLTGCSKEEKRLTPDEIFKETISFAYDIENKGGKIILKDISQEKVSEIINTKLQEMDLNEVSISFGTTNQGIGPDGNGNRVICYKLPTTFNFKGDKAKIEKFVNALSEINSQISINKFDIAEFEDEYSVSCVVSFLGEMNSVGFSGAKGGISLEKNSKEQETKQFSLRDFDLNLTIRPTNSDAASITIGTTDADTCIYSDNNRNENITINFTKEGLSYYAEYSFGDSGESKKVSIKPKGDILFDILSCDKVLDEDEIKANININNTTGKKASVIVYKDKDGRVNISDKTGSVEVSNK